jgi:hypothetical protein
MSDCCCSLASLLARDVVDLHDDDDDDDAVDATDDMEASEHVDMVLMLLLLLQSTALTGNEGIDRRLLLGVFRRGELMVGVNSVGASIEPAISDEDGPPPPAME